MRSKRDHHSHYINDNKELANPHLDITSTNDIIVAIATNEGNQTVLSELRKFGYILVHDVIAAIQSSPNDVNDISNSSSSPSMHPVEQFAIEAQFMIEATYFISYGVSTVNDVVESERRRRNHSWCLYVDEVPQDNWCQIATNSSRRWDNPVMGLGLGGEPPIKHDATNKSASSSSSNSSGTSSGRVRKKKRAAD